MTPELADYLQAGYALTLAERLEAARMLQLSVQRDEEAAQAEAALDDAAQADVDAEWDAVIRRRVEEVLNGKVEPISGRESFARIRARLVDGREAHAQVRAEIAARRK